ncbi:MAG: ABC transporter substrate-binding protein [Saccharofermentanales bacterium]|jgi:spermidine/putrescine transport system substrate-binding protein|nr:ABC transporter substrate-binding protein [Clostridiaceae bacterium]
MKKVVLILLLLAVVVSATLSGCRSGDEKTILTVYNWGEYISRESDTISWRGREYEIKDVIAEFEAAYPQYKVNYQTYDDNEKMYAKLDTESYDILVPSDYMVVRLIKEGRLLELDQSRLPNVKKYLDSRLENLTYDSDQALSDKVSSYAVPYMYCTVGLLYNQEEIAPINTNDPAEAWDILFDSAMDSRIGMYSSMRESIGVALNYYGHSLNTLDSGELDQAKNLLIDQRKNVRPLVGIDELKDKYVSGELLAGVVWSGDHVVCQIRLEEAEEDPDKLQYVLPKGSNLSVDMLCVPKNAANPDGAHDFINFLYEPEIALINAVYVGYSTPHTEALKGLPAEIINNLSYYPDDETMQSLEIYYSSEAIDSTYDRIWQAILAN